MDSHYQWLLDYSNELSLPVDVLTTGPMDAHNHWLFSLSFNWTNELSLDQWLFSLLDQLILTTSGCSHYWTNGFSLPVAVLTTGPMDSRYQSDTQRPVEHAK